MPYTVEHDRVIGVVTITFFGLITGDDLRASTTEGLSLQKQTGVTRFLLDANGWDTSASLVDFYDLADRRYWEGELNRQTRIAVILPTSVTAARAAHFYETVCQNRGWNAKLFDDRASAIAWLRGTNAPGKLAAGRG